MREAYERAYSRCRQRARVQSVEVASKWEKLSARSQSSSGRTKEKQKPQVMKIRLTSTKPIDIKDHAFDFQMEKVLAPIFYTRKSCPQGRIVSVAFAPHASDARCSHRWA